MDSPDGGIILTDRSRLEDGWSFCPRARYLKYHSGASGYGITRKALSLPLATGTYTHDLMADLLTAQATRTRETAAPGLPAPVVIAGAALDPKRIIEKHVTRYKKMAAARGFDEGLADESDRIIAEQAALIEAFGWAAHLYWLPQLFEEFQPVLVEEEIGREITSPGPLPDSPKVFLMLRPDLILRRKIDGALVQVDFKTAADVSYPAWRRQWEDNGQLALQGWGAGQHLGEPVDHAYIYALIKGRRYKGKTAEFETQSTHLLYAYHRAGNPPMVEEDWKLRYEWLDQETGQTRRVGKGYDRTATFQYPFPGKPPEMGNVEYWIRAMPLEDVNSAREILGPFQTSEAQKAAVIRAVVAEEERWQGKLWEVYAAIDAHGGDEAHPEVQEVMNREVPQTWRCHVYGKDCSFLPICRKEPGWEVPLEGGLFQVRRPHHSEELAQARARGVEIPIAEDGSDDAE